MSHFFPFFPGQRASYNLSEQKGSSWVERADIAAAAIRRAVDPIGPVRVADVGCGDRKLERALTRELGDRLVYKGFDILPQSPEVEQLDLAKRPVPGRHTVVALLGVGEYIDDIPALLTRVAQSARFVCFSYTVADSGLYDEAKVAARGWKHHYSTVRLEAFARDLGFLRRSSAAVDGGKTIVWMWEAPTRAETGDHRA